MGKQLLAKKLWLLLLVSSFSSFCFAQVTQEWVARNPQPGTFDGARSLALDNEGNVYVTGSVTGEGTGFDYSTIKYNAAGVQQWEARYNGPGNGDDDAFSIAVDNSGNVYVTGRSEGTETGFDYATIKYNSAGVIQWVARYNGPGNGFDFAKSIAVDAEGNVYVTGESVGAETSSDYATIKYNADGIEQWVARYDGPGRNDAANALALDAAGNVYVTGKSPVGVDLDEQDADYTTIKYDNNGNELWVKRYDGPVAGNFHDEALAITVDESGNVYVTGRSASSNSEDANDYATVKYDANGNELWSARYNGPGNSIDDALSLAVDASQNVYVTGYSAAEPEETNYDYATIKYDVNGNEVWVRRYNGPANANDQATSLALDATGNVYVTGRSTGTGTQYDFATIKYNTTGDEQWVARYNGPANGNDGTGIFIGFFTSHPIAVDDLNNVYVTGMSTGIGTGFDYTTIKYSQALTVCGNNNDKVLICHKGKKTLCINNSDVANHLAHGDQLGACTGDASVARVSTELLGSTTEPARFRMFNVPNPVAAITNIYYELPFDGYVSLQVFDMLGREIRRLVSAYQKAGYYNIYFDASALQKGVYNYRITVKTKTTIWVHTNKLSVLH